MSIFRVGLLDSNTVSKLRQGYQETQPFPHLVVQNIIQDDFLRQVRAEVNTNLQLNFDKNDVYRIRRSTHLANISSPAKYSPGLLPNLTRLRDALNGREFRNWLSDVTGAGPLSGIKSSMAVNLYTPGDHLLVHDDCNPESRNRRVSFILYLTDPDMPWTPEWGGGLRLYDTRSVRNTHGQTFTVAEATWSRYLEPCFNQLIFFAVRPGQTYHEVEEVFHGRDLAQDQDRRRLAISGWFHAAQEGDEAFDEAFFEVDTQKFEHLHWLKAAASEFHRPHLIFRPLDDGEDRAGAGKGTDIKLEPEEVEYLLSYLAPKLLEQGQICRISHRFGETSFLQVQPFFCEHFEAKLRNYTEGSNGIAETTFKWCTPWEVAIPPERQRFLYLESLPNPPSRNDPISQVMGGLLQSRAFRKWLALVTGLQLHDFKGQNVMARRFRRCMDYILSDSQSPGQLQLDYTIGITPTSTNQYDAEIVKDTRENGGEEIYRITSSTAVELMFAGKGPYKEGGHDAGYGNPPSWNTISVTLRRNGMQNLVQYVHQAAGGDRWDIKGRLQLQQ